MGTDEEGFSGVVKVRSSLVFNSIMTSAREGICDKSSFGGLGGAEIFEIKIMSPNSDFATNNK